MPTMYHHKKQSGEKNRLSFLPHGDFIKEAEKEE